MQSHDTFELYRIKLPTTGGPEWHNYFLCGIKGVADNRCSDISHLKGMKVAVVGDIPAASGLSSSSALVSSAVLATSSVNNVCMNEHISLELTIYILFQYSLNKELLSTIAAHCERYIGTQGGGMDQAIAFLAQEGKYFILNTYLI